MYYRVMRYNNGNNGWDTVNGYDNLVEAREAYSTFCTANPNHIYAIRCKPRGKMPYIVCRSDEQS